METIAVHSGVGVKTQARGRSLVRSVFAWFAWVYDRFDFWVIHRGRRLRPEVEERLDREDEEERQGKNVRSPGFTNAADMIKWLDSQTQ